MVIEKRCNLRGEIALLQYCFPNESIAGVYHNSSNRPLRSNVSAESPDFAATLFSKSLNVARRELEGGTGSLAIFFTKRSGPRNGAPSPDATPHDNSL